MKKPVVFDYLQVSMLNRIKVEISEGFDQDLPGGHPATSMHIAGLLPLAIPFLVARV